MEKVPYEQVYITSFDGTKLAARYYHLSDSAALQIQFHGYRSTAVRDFSGGFQLAQKMGRNLLVVDQRASGKSEGTTICFGIKEKYDCLEWIKYALERFGDIPIMLTGVSMGGATVLMASELDLPENVKCIVSDCPYTSPYEIIAREFKFIEEFSPEMCGIGPFIPQKDTPFKNEKSGTAEETAFYLSIIRLIKPNILLPATTALGTIKEGGRELGIISGANVLMPNLSPQKQREKYTLYDNKLATGIESAEKIEKLKEQMLKIGYEIITDRGDIKL